MQAGRFVERLSFAGGLLVAVLATVVAVRTWLGERSFAEGVSAQRHGQFRVAEAAYRAASARGNADAAAERARLEIARGDWTIAGESLREAMALAPARAYPHVLQAVLEINSPGPWDGAREDRVLLECRRAVALEAGRSAIWSESAGALLDLAALRRGTWDARRTRAVMDEAADGFSEALEREPRAARDLFARMLKGGNPAFLLEAAARRVDPSTLSALVGVLLERDLWAGAEPELWDAAAARGIVPAFAAAASESLARRSLFREALAAAQRGLLAAPADGPLLVRAADAAARLPGQDGLAAAPLYRAAVAADPANAAARRRFAGFLAARQLLREAEDVIRAAVAADPSDAEAWFLLGEITRRGGRAGDAAAAYRKASDLRPGNAAYRKAAGGDPR